MNVKIKTLLCYFDLFLYFAFKSITFSSEASIKNVEKRARISPFSCQHIFTSNIIRLLIETPQKYMTSKVLLLVRHAVERLIWFHPHLAAPLLSRGYQRLNPDARCRYLFVMHAGFASASEKLLCETDVTVTVVVRRGCSIKLGGAGQEIWNYWVDTEMDFRAPTKGVVWGIVIIGLVFQQNI